MKLKASISKRTKKPVLWVVLLIMSFSLGGFFNEDHTSKAIYSDGKGYYAYLPALFIFNDPSYKKSSQAELKYEEEGFNQLYLYKTNECKVVNKYFPGIAVLQSPFFAMACAVSAILNQPIDGYSYIFQLFFYLGSLFYTVFGVILFSKSINLLYPNRESTNDQLVFVAIIGTPLIYYLGYRYGLSHLYSFFAFGLFSYLILKLKSSIKLTRLFFIGFVLGLITIIRPTNILIVLMIPFLLGDFTTLKNILKQLFLTQKTFGFIALLGFVIPVFFLLFTWKWQTGNWISWSYSGEGFNFSKPMLATELFSFRVGLFIHTPITILAIVGTFFMYRQNKFQFIFWWIYFLLQLYIISSWWCWDFETPFGNRPFTEHLFFILLPLTYLLKKKHVVVSGVILFLVSINLLRLYQVNTGIIAPQRFTQSNYFSSLLFWNKENKGRWNWTESCIPHGNVIKENIIFNRTDEITVSPNDTFLFTRDISLAQNRTTERLFYIVELEKQLINPNFEDVYLIIDAVDHESPKRNYISTALFQDKQEGSKEWVKLTFQGSIYDNFKEFDKLKIYIWNSGKKKFKLRNISFKIQTYKAD